MNKFKRDNKLQKKLSILDRTIREGENSSWSRVSLNIVVVKNRALGDSVIGLSSLSYIKTIFPNAKIFYGLPGWILPFYSKIRTEADGYFNIDLKNLRNFFSLGKLLWSSRADVIIELHQKGRSGKFLKCFSFLTRTPYFYHNHNKKIGTFIHNQGQRAPAIQRDLDGCWSIFSHLLKAQNKSIPYPSYLNYPPQIKVHESQSSSSLGEDQNNIICLGVVATRDTKKWSLNNYKALCEELLKIKGNLKFLIPLSQSEEDLAIEREIYSLNFPNSTQIIKAPISELPLVLSRCKLYIGNDTGLKHIAVALGMKTLTFFGPEEPFEWHPYQTNDHKYFFVEGLECRTRDAHFCGLAKCESMICLKQIKWEDVTSVILKEGFL